MIYVGFRLDEQEESGIKKHHVNLTELRQELEKIRQTAEIIWKDIELNRA